MPRIGTPRAVLRPLEDRDVDALLRIFGDRRVTRYWSSPPLADRPAAAELLASIRRGRDAGDVLQWGLARREDDRVLGTVTLARIDRTNRRAELGFALGHTHWGAGWMAEALPAIVEHAFGGLRLHRLEADVDPRNAASLRRLERLGFVREGHLRERWHVQGEIQDSVLLGLLAADWSAGRRMARPERPGRGPARRPRDDEHAPRTGGEGPAR
jgi:RimJ/RimL family protein N-acetyltransferase